MYLLIRTLSFSICLAIVGDSDEALYSKEFFPEALDEHKKENTDRVKMLLEGEFYTVF